jgi:hypothetical protein
MAEKTDPSASKATKAEESAKGEPYRLRHFLDGKPRHYARLMLAHDQVLAAEAAKKKEKHTPLTLDSEGTEEAFAKALEAARKARL